MSINPPNVWWREKTETEQKGGPMETSALLFDFALCDRFPAALCRGRCPHRPHTGCCVSARCRLTAIIKIACGAASEEASCIPFPPGRRKLHIRWLLLPFQTVTAALGHSLGIRVHFRFRRFSFFSSPGAAVLFFLRKEKEKNGGAKASGGQCPPLRCLLR